MDNVNRYIIDCEEDLSKYSAAKSEAYSSLLFDSDETIANFDAYDKARNHIDIWFAVRGDKEVFLYDKEGDACEQTYTRASDYPEELVRAIKEGEFDKDYGCYNNNWYEAFVEIYDKKGNLVHQFEDPDIDIPKTKEEFTKTCTDWANQIFDDMYRDNLLECPKEKPKTIEKD